MKLLYPSDYDSQRDTPLSFYEKQRQRYHNGEKDNDYDKSLSSPEAKKKSLEQLKYKIKIDKIRRRLKL